MHLCYIDESGTSAIPGNCSHYVLAALSVPDSYWKNYNRQVEEIKQRYGLSEAEIHVAWMMRPYVEQEAIEDFDIMSEAERRSQVQSSRTAELLRLQKVDSKRYQQTRKNYGKTQSYVHLTLEQRRETVKSLADCLSNWGSARLFAECIDKVHFDPTRSPNTVDEQAFEQIVSRFEHYLQNTSAGYGLLIHDNNATVARKHTDIMKKFLNAGTFWTRVENIIETPMFVDSQLTSMIQLADLCAYALRRYLENAETELFDLVFQRADKINNRTVGVRHFTKPGCDCRICLSHNA